MAHPRITISHFIASDPVGEEASLYYRGRHFAASEMVVEFSAHLIYEGITPAQNL